MEGTKSLSVLLVNSVPPPPGVVMASVYSNSSYMYSKEMSRQTLSPRNLHDLETQRPKAVVSQVKQGHY